MQARGILDYDFLTYYITNPPISILFCIIFSSVYDFTFHLHFYHSMNEKHSQGLLPDNFRNLSART